MESDYGWSLSVDFEEEYSDAEVLTPLRDDVGEADEEADEEFIPLKLAPVAKKKQTGNKGQTMRGQKPTAKRKRRKLTGPEEFFRLVLSWPIEKLILDNRKALNLAPLEDMPSYYLNKLVYFDTMRQVAVEEARAVLSQGLKNSSDQIDLKLIKMHSCSEDSSLVLIVFSILKGIYHC